MFVCIRVFKSNDVPYHPKSFTHLEAAATKYQKVSTERALWMRSMHIVILLVLDNPESDEETVRGLSVVICVRLLIMGAVDAGWSVKTVNKHGLQK